MPRMKFVLLIVIIAEMVTVLMTTEMALEAVMISKLLMLAVAMMQHGRCRRM